MTRSGGASPSTADDYEIVSVTKTDAPRGLGGNGWHRYVIGQGDNRIQGFRQGDLASVTQSVEGIVERMNERRYGRRGRVQLAMSGKGKATGSR